MVEAFLVKAKTIAVNRESESYEEFANVPFGEDDYVFHEVWSHDVTVRNKARTELARFRVATHKYLNT